MVAFIDEHREAWGVEPICNVVRIAPSTYYRLKSLEKAPEKRSPRQLRDTSYKAQILRVWKENHEVYGARKIWRQMQREGVPIARCTVERLMNAMGLKGVTRGKAIKWTTVPSNNNLCPLDLVQRSFCAERPNQL
jgi:putative transposase